MNNNIILSYPNRATAATITGGSWSAFLPAQNVTNKEMWKVARSTDDALASTKFTADLGALKPVRCVALANHNLSANAAVLVKVMGESGNQNLLTYSEQFDNAAWSKNGIQPFGSGSVANAITAPDGMSTADKIVISTENSVHIIQQFKTTSNTLPMTAAFYAKAGEVTQVTFVQQEATTYARYSYCTFNLSSGTVGVVQNVAGASLSSASIDAVGEGWYRCSLTTTLGGIDPNSVFSIYIGASLIGYTGDGTSGIYIWGAQLEAGAFPTTYKPTTTTPSNIALHYSSGWKPAWRMAFDNLVEWESMTWWTGTAGDEYLRSPYAVTTVADDTYSARYVSVEINDTTNADGYVQIGRLFVGGALQPTYNASYGLQDGMTDLSSTDAAESGAFWGTERRRLRYTSFVLPYTTPTEAAYLHEMQRTLGTIGEVLYIPYPSDPGESQRWGYIGRMSELSPIDYPYYRVRSIALKLEEIA